MTTEAYRTAMDIGTIRNALHSVNTACAKGMLKNMGHPQCYEKVKEPVAQWHSEQCDRLDRLEALR